MTLFQAAGEECTGPVWLDEAVIVDARTKRTLKVGRNGVGSHDDDVHRVAEDVTTLTAAPFKNDWYV